MRTTSNVIKYIIGYHGTEAIVIAYDKSKRDTNRTLMTHQGKTTGDGRNGEL